jgi:hypothetical protein
MRRKRATKISLIIAEMISINLKEVFKQLKRMKIKLNKRLRMLSKKEILLMSSAKESKLR